MKHNQAWASVASTRPSFHSSHMIPIDCLTFPFWPLCGVGGDVAAVAAVRRAAAEQSSKRKRGEQPCVPIAPCGACYWRLPCVCSAPSPSRRSAATCRPPPIAGPFAACSHDLPRTSATGAPPLPGMPTHHTHSLENMFVLCSSLVTSASIRPSAKTRAAAGRSRR